jgi:RNA polymerase sigma factor (sigma-70 family)
MAYERVARRWPRIRKTGHPEAYARKILVNLAIDDRKRRARRRDVFVGSAVDVDRLGARADVRPDLPHSALEEVLAALPAKQRAVVVLRYWCDLSEHEIAATLGISPGTVKSHAARAMETLRRHLIQAESEGERR